MSSLSCSLHNYLSSQNKKLSSRLSQNFLIDQNVVNKFLRLADLSPDDSVLEIGPGAGAITQALVNHGCRVFAVEKDRQLIEKLTAQYADHSVTFFHQDILDFDLSAITGSSKRLKVVSNLPFKITSLIFDKFFPLRKQVESLTLILQKDILDRLLAKPNCKAYSSLTLFTHYYAEIAHTFDISSNCYFPKPKVKTCAVTFKLRETLAALPDNFWVNIRKAFSQRRKMLSNTLGYESAIIQKALVRLNLSAQARPENLSLQNFIDLLYLLETPTQK